MFHYIELNGLICCVFLETSLAILLTPIIALDQQDPSATDYLVTDV